MPTKRMGPAARSFAADAHDCIMVRIQTVLPHTSLWHEDAPQWRAPLRSSADRQAPSDAGAFAKKPLSQFIIPARAQASRRCETQAPLGGKPPALLAFRSPDPFRALREPDRRRRDEERLSRSEQRTSNKPKTTLDRKSPIQVRIPFPPPASRVRTVEGGAAVVMTGADLRPASSARRRETASWSGSERTFRIQVCGANMRPNGKLPSDHYPDRRRQTPQLRREAHLAVHRLSACSGNLIPGTGRTPSSPRAVGSGGST